MWHTKIERNEHGNYVVIPQDYLEYAGLKLGEKVVFNTVGKSGSGSLLIKKGE
jgi:antitoxin component of MazEF toxin-antitoxin module